MSTPRIGIRRDTAAGWAAVSGTATDLQAGEFGYETDTGLMKLGDGSTAYSSLPYVSVGPTATQTLTNKTLTNPVISGGAYFGGTAAANLLDDYEEGTWTPTLTCDSGSVVIDAAHNLLAYTKIGRLVTITGTVVVASVSTPGGTLYLNGLPFASATLAESAHETRAFVALRGLASSINLAQMQMGNAVTFASILQFSGATEAPDVAQTMQAGSKLSFQFMYLTA